MYEREYAIPGHDVYLWLYLLDATNRNIVTPESVGTVNIYHEISGTRVKVATITPILANPGTYLAKWSIPGNAAPGVYYDEWTSVVRNCR